MTNFEYLKSLTSEEFAKNIVGGNCDYCAFNDLECYGRVEMCKVGIAKWLDQERGKPCITTVKDGARFIYNGVEFIRLGKEQDGILCITAKVWKDIAFDKDGCNNFKKASVKKLLNGEFLSLLNENDLLPYTMDLTADNGDKAYGTDTAKVGLLSTDLYRKYRDFIPLYPEWMWTCTAWYCSDLASSIRSVDTEGTLYDSGTTYANGVVPAVIFREDL